MNRTALACTSVASAALVASIALLAAGPLNPPAGPVASSYKTLSEVEPRIAINATNTPGDASSVFRISAPGSYYLTANVAGVASKNGIVIAAANVTLDLRGFAVKGVAGSLNGIMTSGANLANIIIREGSVTDWGTSGIDLAFGSAEGTLIESVSAKNNGLYGLRSGNHSVVRFCAATDNTSFGIIGFGSSIVESCNASANAGFGFGVGSGAIVRGCTARTNTLDGINSSGSCVIVDCFSGFNNGTGFNLAANSRISACVATANGSDGILVTAGCMITSNDCTSNGVSVASGANIHATSSDNRIEGNNCSGGDRGITVDSTGNVIIRNTCSGAAINWVIAANNVVGPILDRTAPASAAISGNSAADSTASTHPNANFSY